MITRNEIDELFEWASTTKFPLYKLNNPEYYSNKRIDYSWHKLVDHKNKSTIRRKFMTERIIEIHKNPDILWSAMGIFYAGTKVNKHKDPNIFSEPYKRIQIPIKYLIMINVICYGKVVEKLIGERESHKFIM